MSKEPKIGDPVVVNKPSSKYHGYAAFVYGVMNGNVVQVRLKRYAVKGEKNLIPIESRDLEFMHHLEEHPCLMPGRCQCWTCGDRCTDGTCDDCETHEPTKGCENYVFTVIDSD